MKNDIINSKNRGGILDVIISFFRDFLSGPLYITVVVISVIGIFACIGYLAEGFINLKEEEKKRKKMYAEVHLLPTDNASGSYVASNVETSISSAQLNQVGDVSATNIAQSTALDSNVYNQVSQTGSVTPSANVSTTSEPKQ